MSYYSKTSAAEQHLRQILGMSEQKEDDVTLRMGSEESDEDVKKNKIRIFCVDLARMPNVVQFLVLCGAVFFFYLIYGYLQVCDCLTLKALGKFVADDILKLILLFCQRK